MPGTFSVPFFCSRCKEENRDLKAAIRFWASRSSCTRSEVQPNGSHKNLAFWSGSSGFSLERPRRPVYIHLSSRYGHSTSTKRSNRRTCGEAIESRWSEKRSTRWHKKKKKAKTKQNSREMGIDYASSHMCTSNNVFEQPILSKSCSETRKVNATRFDDSQLLFPDKCFACLPIDQKLIIPVRDTKHTALGPCTRNNC